jgi:hypothetical protein
MSFRDPSRGRPVLGSFGLGGPLPRDLAVLLVVLFTTYAMQFFSATALLPALMRLSPLVWRNGFVWQLATYPFAGWGPASLWFLLELLVLYWFGRDVFAGLRRRHFWTLIAWCTVVGGAVAVVVDVIANSVAAPSVAALEPGPYPLIQGQQLLIAVFVTAFATANRQAQILLFFVLPIEARWFIAIEIVIAFILFLQSHDLPGFLGLCAAIGIAYVYVRDGGIGRGLRQTRLRAQRWWLERRLSGVRRKRGFRVVPSDRDQGRGGWLN